jgi:hypothetical protein
VRKEVLLCHISEKPRFRSLRFGCRCGVSSSHAERSQPTQDDRSAPAQPVQTERGFELKRSGAAATQCCGEMVFRLFD